MKPIIIRSKILTKILSVFITVGAITLFPFIIINPEYDNEITINHESIHIEQQRELWVILFYILYVFYWIKNKINRMNNFDAYMNIPFEKEAYEKQYDFNYISNERKKHDWKNYL